MPSQSQLQLQSHIDTHTESGDFNAPGSSLDRSCRQKLNRERSLVFATFWVLFSTFLHLPHTHTPFQASNTRIEGRDKKKRSQNLITFLLVSSLSMTTNQPITTANPCETTTTNNKPTLSLPLRPWHFYTLEKVPSFPNITQLEKLPTVGKITPLL